MFFVKNLISGSKDVFLRLTLIFDEKVSIQIQGNSYFFYSLRDKNSLKKIRSSVLNHCQVLVNHYWSTAVPKTVVNLYILVNINLKYVIVFCNIDTTPC